MTSLLPPRSSIGDIHFSIFTILRHPIDRIEARAFYGNSVGLRLLKDVVRERCFSFSPRKFDLRRRYLSCWETRSTKKDCHCLYQSFEVTIQSLQTNETLWEHWFQDHYFGNSYMPNYYVKRIGYGESKSHGDAPNCLRNVSKNCGGPSLLHLLTPASRCIPTSVTNITEDRILAEVLLETQYDIFILEKYSDISTPYFVCSLFRENDVELIREHLKESH